MRTLTRRQDLAAHERNRTIVNITEKSVVTSALVVGAFNAAL
jgi:hypothetical protein